MRKEVLTIFINDILFPVKVKKIPLLLMGFSNENEIISNKSILCYLQIDSVDSID